MNYLNITFVSLFGLSVVLYSIFYFLKFKITSTVFSALQIPLLIGATLSFLFKFTPDSLHIILQLTFSLIFICVSDILLQPIIENKVLHKLGQLFIFLATLIMANLFSNIFRIFHIPLWTIILPVLLFILSYVLLIFLGTKQKFTFYFTLFLFCSALSFFIYEAFLNLLFYKNLATSLLFSGTIIFYIQTVLYTLSKIRFKIKHSEFINQISLLIGIMLINTACILFFII